MNRIHHLFQTRKKGILSVYFTAGYPEVTDTVPIAKALQAEGADMLEIGIPFSDPVADGPVIQQSNQQALAKGMHVSLLLEQVKEIRESVTLPIVLMGYLNPIYQFGVERLLRAARDCGVDGLIIPDLPLTEYERKYKALADELQLTVTFLVTPTTPEQRIHEIDRLSSGFIYAVAASSTTGVREGFTDEQLRYFERLQRYPLRNPFLVGFGIGSRAAIQQVEQYASGVIVGSAFIKSLALQKPAAGNVPAFIAQLRN
jgi:tryptophan synthase alpha chain